MGPYPDKRRYQKEKTSQRQALLNWQAFLPSLLNPWKAALLTKSPVSWKELVQALIILLSADGFTVTSFMFLVLKTPTNRKRSVHRKNRAGSLHVEFSR